MFTLNSITNPLHRRYYQFALASFVALSLGYLLRGQVDQSHSLVRLFLDVFPNLLGSIGTPFILAFLLDRRFSSLKALDTAWVFGLINLFNFAVCLLIEYLHVVLKLGNWDWNDVYASAAGGFVSLALFFLARSIWKTT